MLKQVKESKSKQKLILSKTRSISRICSRLYLGDWDGACKIGHLKQRNICAVVTIHINDLPEEVKKQYSDNGIQHLFIEATDSPSSKLPEHFDEGYRFILKHMRKGGVFVHCVMGMSRSPTMVMYFLMRYMYERESSIEERKGSVLDLVYRHVLRRRSCIAPIMTFVHCLEHEEVKLAKTRVEIKTWLLSSQ